MYVSNPKDRSFKTINLSDFFCFFNRLPREIRICDVCYEIESHVIFKCPRYNLVREKYNNLLTKNNNVCKFLNPSINEIKETANYLHDIEKLRNK